MGKIIDRWRWDADIMIPCLIAWPLFEIIGLPLHLPCIPSISVIYFCCDLILTMITVVSIWGERKKGRYINSARKVEARK